MIKRYLKAAAGVLCMLAMMLSCEKEIEKYDEVELTPMTIGQNMKSATFEVEVPLDNISNEWYVNSPSADTWLTHEIIPGTKSMWVMIDGNVTGAVRSSYIQIRCKGQLQKIIVNQDCDPVMVLSRSTANFRYQGGNQTVKIMNSADLKNIVPTVEADWVTVRLEEDSVILEAKENPVEERRETTLTITAERAISGEVVSGVVTLSQDKYGQRVSYEYSKDGGQTWLEDIPAEFEVLTVRTNNGVKLSAADISAFKASITEQNAPAGLDLGQADYESETFPADAFAGTAINPNTTLSYIKFPKNVKTVASKAFQYCTALETMDLNAVSTLGEEVFRYSGLKRVNVPNTVTAYGKYVFADCLALEEVYFNSPYDSGTNANGGTDKPNEKYMFYTVREDITDAKLVVTIGPDVRYIQRTLFRHAYNMKKLVCEDAVYFRNYCIAYCANLAEIEFRCTDQAKVTDQTYFHISSPWDGGHVKAGANVSDKKIIVPSGMSTVYGGTSVVTTLTGVGYSLTEAE